MSKRDFIGRVLIGVTVGLMPAGVYLAAAADAEVGAAVFLGVSGGSLGYLVVHRLLGGYPLPRDESN
jgi:hypothetical protein